MRKQAKCDCCLRRAKLKIRFPIAIYLCSRCWHQMERLLEKQGVRTVHVPSGTSEAELRQAVVREVAQTSDRLVVWIARNPAEYERGRELGMIDGWASWEVYEHQMQTTLSSVDDAKLVILNATPDDILASLEKRGLPNTSEARSMVFIEMAIERHQLGMASADHTAGKLRVQSKCNANKEDE